MIRAVRHHSARRLAESRVLQYLALAAAIVALAIIGVRLAVRPSSDLMNHREFGRRFVAGTYLYEGGLNYPYLPTWAVAHAPLALVPAPVVSVLVFAFGASALVALISLLDQVSRARLLLDATRAWVVPAAAIVLVSRFLIRDLLDGGENLILTAFAWGALFAWLRHRFWMGAWLLGAAIALKLTAAVFLLPLIARRHYAWAVAASACAAILIALPAVRMGTDSYRLHLQRWTNGVRAGLSSADPSVGVLGPEPGGNLAIRPAIGRLLVDQQSSASWRKATSWIAAALLVALTAVLFLLMRRLPGPPGLSDAVAWGAAGVLGLLISPITWRAHAVAILPATYLLIRRWVVEGRLWHSALIGLVAVAVPAVLLARGVVGERISDWSDSWSLTTIALICLAVGTAQWSSRH